MNPTRNPEKIPHLPEDYDERISSVLPYYSSFHQETINLVRSFPEAPQVWLDTGCGTGAFVSKALEHFPETRFLLLDPSEGMLEQARKKLAALKRLEFLKPSVTQDFSQELEERPDVITAIQCHHYLSRGERAKAVAVCYELLKENGVFITFENIRPLTEEGIVAGKRYWGDYQAARGRSAEEIKAHLARFDTEYFPVTVEEHLQLLRNTGFRTVELFWYSYMQAGFYCIKQGESNLFCI
jgi:tRNA (cmo5U34)-methyltransferase